MQPNFRNPVFNEPRLFGGQYGFNTPVGVVTSSQAPPLPPRPSGFNITQLGNPLLYANGGNPYGFYNGFSGFGSYAGYTNGYGSNHGYAMSSNLPEYRFIQLAEQSSRPAFQNIQSLVGTIGNIATMLDSTFFALISSFRAVLGMAANFAHLRGVFSHFWTSFALFRWVIWAYKKIFYMLKITKTDPTTESFREAFKIAETNDGAGNRKKGSSMAVILFLGFIMSAPYLLTKFFGSKIPVEQSKNPSEWVNPVQAMVVYSFDASNPQELSIRAGQSVNIAPKSIQIEHDLLNTGWILATVDNINSGLIPVNYVQSATQPSQTKCNVLMQADKQLSSSDV